MPELPEVETLRRSLEEIVCGATLVKLRFYRKKLRFPIPTASIKKRLLACELVQVSRRSKYLNLAFSSGDSLLVHLGMSGQLLHLKTSKPEFAHTHVLFEFVDRLQRSVFLHYVDPRRFGFMDVFETSAAAHQKFLKNLGPEPLLTAKLGTHLWRQARGKSKPIKNFIMDASNVVGVGNIYASESLFQVGIHPKTAAGELTKQQCDALGRSIKKTLRAAIRQGGTTLKDFKNASGAPGYFKQKLHVYAREGEPCLRCKAAVKKLMLSGRASYYCPHCQGC